MAFSAVRASREVLVRSGKGAGRNLCVCGGDEKKAGGRKNCAAKETDRRTRMTAIPGCGSFLHQAIAGGLSHRTDPSLRRIKRQGQWSCTSVMRARRGDQHALQVYEVWGPRQKGIGKVVSHIWHGREDRFSSVHGQAQITCS